MESKVYLALGSNMGRRRAFIGRAAAAILMRLPVTTVMLSAMYENEADGFVSDNRFLNAVAELVFERSAAWTNEDALGLLDALQEIERTLSDVPHRNSDGSYCDREIDIDIIAIEDFEMTDSRLLLPHPRAFSRDFVMIPLRRMSVGESVLQSLLRKHSEGQTGE